MYVIKDVRIGESNMLAYEVGAMVNGVWFMLDVVADKGDAMQMCNYCNGGNKMPDKIKAKYCLVIVPTDAPVRIIGPVKTRELRDDLAREWMRKLGLGTQFYALTWRRDYMPEIRPMNRQEVKIRERMYLGSAWITDGEHLYRDTWTFRCEPNNADDEYAKSLQFRFKEFTPDEDQDQTWNDESGRTIEESGYVHVLTHQEHTLQEYIA
jgi:hypothetical protein